MRGEFEGGRTQMVFTDFQASYYAHELTRRCPSDSVEKLAAVLADAQAQVDLNPHQVEAALFAFRNPFSKGAILADEVGLGKTIEAGLLLAQKWAERKRRLLAIVPANLRKQWAQELAEKFYLPSCILETRTFNEAVRAGNLNPFLQDGVVLCSYQFAKTKDAYIRQTQWDLVVIDEAHRLRNVYKGSSKIAAAIKDAVAASPKVLLTATPLQNSSLELYGLVSIVDDLAFGDLKSYRARFSRLTSEADAEATSVEGPPTELSSDYEAMDQLADEWDGDSEDASVADRAALGAGELAELREELEQLRGFHALAKSIAKNSKGEVLLTALRRGFEAAASAQKSRGTPTLQEKAVIFTESRRTQEYLLRLLEQAGFAGKVVLFNGTNADSLSKEIYRRWMEKHAGTDRVSGSPTADMRAALVEHFRDHASILVATEAAAEGINLQFCNLVVNYDLPWNPQRIEQRMPVSRRRDTASCSSRIPSPAKQSTLGPIGSARESKTPIRIAWATRLRSASWIAVGCLPRAPPRRRFNTPGPEGTSPGSRLASDRAVGWPVRASP